MGQAARMLSSELEMYPMIAVAPEMAMVRTAGSICIAGLARRTRARQTCLRGFKTNDGTSLDFLWGID